MGVSYGEPGGEFYTGILDISSGTPSELTGRDTRGYYNTLNPAGTRMITTTPTGGLDLWDTSNGQLLKAIDTQGLKLTQPDWSPDGAQLAVIAADDLTGDIAWVHGRLMVGSIDDDGDLGTLTELTGWEQRDDHANVFYPSFSPDGAWIAFDTGAGISYNNTGATLQVIPSAGGTPIELANANQGADLANSWPHWGPLPDDEVFWLTFSSHRSYGDLVTDGRPQIWVAAFRPSLAEAGEDPSSPAFWLPNQDMETSNHSTFWGP
jgi:Tol biopolymer transport system component